MSKAPVDTIKYIIYADVSIDGVVDKPDVVGAIFGHAEGLLGEDLELRDLQKTGRIGRIEVTLNSVAGKSVGKIIVPSSLDIVETSIIASAVEMVDRVGPCGAIIKIINIEDTRSAKRKKIIDRAKELVKKMMIEQIPDSQRIEEEVRGLVQTSQIITYKGTPAGSDIETSETVIIVEGRADILNLLKADIKNTIAVEGTNVPDVVVELTKKKSAIAFLDGDRGGDIILRELLQKADIDYVARAPKGKEVEDLGKKEIIMALRKKIPATQLRQEETTRTAENEQPVREHSFSLPVKPYEKPPVEEQKEDSEIKIKNALLEQLQKIKGSLMAKLFDKEIKRITEIEIKDMLTTIQSIKPYAIVFDGIITQRLIDGAAENGVKYIAGINQAMISNAKEIVLILEKR
ncbi:MAG: DNA primase DnaG [Candidatus Altarchaeum sp.]|nr:DNA primase DnaG [Candidatus Altarchaeum sp.]